MLVKIIRALVAVLMVISPNLPQKLSLPAIPNGQDLELESRFELVWEDEFEGDKLDTSKWGFPWWETERKGGYWHEDLVSVKDGNLVITTAYYDEPLENYYYENWHDRIDFNDYKEGWYTGCIETRGKYEFCYGYYECRCILPKS